MKISDIKSENILVIGDVMLDTYFNGNVIRISPEAPVPVFRKVSERSVPGGAANVAANLVAAGQKVSIMSIVGKDEAGNLLKKKLERSGVNTELMIPFSRDTTIKTRFVAANNQQVLRLDIEDTREISQADCHKLLLALGEKIESFKLLLLSDYLKGLLSYEFTQGILKLAKDKGIPVIVDVKDPKVEKYKNAFLLKPNLSEVKALTGCSVDTDLEIIQASEKLKKLCSCKYVLTTCGARGMVLVGDGSPYFIKSSGKEVYDVTGAGDTTIAYLAACIVNGFTIRQAVEFSNYAAGIQVSKLGTSSVYWHEIREYLSEQKKGIIHKLLSGNEIKDFRRKHEKQKIVFTNGCFDILHIGHIRYMQEAAKLGDILVVGLNSDDSVSRLKGPKRPVNNEMNRAELLCALGFVDYVAIFDEDTPLNLVASIQPDVLVKGEDYKLNDVVGKDIVETRGGRVVLIPLVEGKSTTGVLQKIKCIENV